VTRICDSAETAIPRKMPGDISLPPEITREPFRPPRASSGERPVTGSKTLVQNTTATGYRITNKAPSDKLRSGGRSQSQECSMAATLTQMYTLRPAHAFVPRAGRRPADTNARSDTNAPPSRTQSPRWKRPKQQARRSWLSQMLMRERTKDYDAPDDEVVQRHEELEAQIANLEHRRQEAAARLAATAVPSRPPSRGAPSGVVAERLLGSAVPTTPATNRLEAVTHQPKRPASAMLSTHRTSRNNDTNDIKQTPRQYGTALLLKMGLPRAQTPDERTYITNSARDLLAQRGFSAVQKPPPPRVSRGAADWTAEGCWAERDATPAGPDHDLVLPRPHRSRPSTEYDKEHTQQVCDRRPALSGQ